MIDTITTAPIAVIFNVEAGSLKRSTLPYELSYDI